MLKDLDGASQDQTSATSSTSLPRDISVVTPEGEGSSSSLPMPSSSTSDHHPRKRRTGSNDVGDRLYQQARESVRRKEENAARSVSEEETFSPKLVAKQFHSSIRRSSPFQRLYSLALQRKQIEEPHPPSSSNVKNSQNGKKIVFTPEKAAELYERGIRHQEETRARNDSIASSLTPSFTPKKFTSKHKSTASPVTHNTPRTANTTQHAGVRLYEQGKERQQPLTPRHASSPPPPPPKSEDEECTFKPDITKSQRQHPSHVISPVFERLQTPERPPLTPLNTSLEEKDYTFKPDISASQRHHPSPMAASPVFQRLQQEGSFAAQKRMQDWKKETKEEESPLTKKKVVLKSSARIDSLYEIGLKKEQGRRLSDKEERDARYRKIEENELRKCTFKPRTHWAEDDEPGIPDMIPLEIETHTHAEVSQLDTVGSQFGGGGGDGEMAKEKIRTEDRPDHVNIGSGSRVSTDVIGYGAEDVEETDSIEIGSV